MHTPNALSLGDRVMVMQDDKIVFHAIAKVAIIPGNARVFHKFFKIFIFALLERFREFSRKKDGGDGYDLISNYDINIIVIAVNNIVLFIDF